MNINESGNVYVLREIVDEEEIDKKTLIDRIDKWSVVHQAMGSRAVLDRLEKNDMIINLKDKYLSTAKGISYIEDIRHLLTRDLDKEIEERKKKAEARARKRAEAKARVDVKAKADVKTDV